MKYSFIRSLCVALFLIPASISPLAYAHTSGGIVVKDAWVREAPAVAKVLAGYMNIENHTGEIKTLTSISSSAFEKVEIHKTVQEGDMTSMVKQNKLAIAAQGSVKLEPGATHLMLFNPKNEIKAGESVSFVLNFANGSKSIVSAKVKKVTGKDNGHQHMNHGHHNHDREKEKIQNNHPGHGNHESGHGNHHNH